MNFKIIHNLEELSNIKEEWNFLISNIDQQEIFYTWEWSYEYIKKMDYHLKDSLRIVLAYEKNILIGIIPLLKDNKTLRFITNKTVDYNNIYIHKNYNKYIVIEKALEFIFNNENFCEIVLNNIPNSSELYIINDIVKSKFNCFTLLEDSVITPKLVLKEENKLKYRSKQLKDIDRRKRKLEKEKDVQAFIGCGFDENIFNFIIENHSKKWAKSVLKNKNYLEFYLGIKDILPENIEMSKLEVDGKIVAAHFGFKDDKKVYYYIPIYDEEYSNCGVGYILLKEIIDFYSDKVEFDFLRGNENYKFNWCDNVGMNYNLYIFKENKKIMSLLTYIKIYLKKSQFLRKLLNK